MDPRGDEDAQSRTQLHGEGMGSKVTAVWLPAERGSSRFLLSFHPSAFTQQKPRSRKFFRALVRRWNGLWNGQIVEVWVMVTHHHHRNGSMVEVEGRGEGRIERKDRGRNWNTCPDTSVAVSPDGKTTTTTRCTRLPHNKASFQEVLSPLLWVHLNFSRHHVQ